MNTILVLSEGPPPLGDTIAEGGALRAWGLAKGLSYNGHLVTLAYRSTFNIGEFNVDEIPKNINLAVWDGDKLDDLLREHKIIVMRYAMGEAIEITSRLREDHILVSDSYIPISVEVAARNSSDEFEQENYLQLQKSSLIATRRADYILYASPSQELYYIGYLSGINKLNPTTYKLLENRMYEIPYGVDSNDNKGEINHPKNPTLLWYGAFYSWFDMESLVKGLEKLKKDIPDFKLIIAGAKNPYNKDAGLLAHYEKTVKSLDILGDTVEYIDWHPYKDRFKVYNLASVIITQNHVGLENKLAWRTRLMDYVLAKKPIITNGGDPLGDYLISKGVAFRSEADEVVETFKLLLKSPPSNRQYDEVIDHFSWINITKKLSDDLCSPSRLESGEMEYKLSVKSKLKKVILRIKRKIDYIRIHGPKQSILRAKEKIKFSRTAR